ncbi:coenzyme dependent N5,N10-methylene tetrahydromethanopterin reductase [Xylariales sp. PMI_506]|nr:coenzyme dependent N5,N10-methylene tetrahydromethanopterin reductase [Xylariales sp. PMI_506]
MGETKKQIQLNFFEVTCAGTVNAIGQWKDPNDNSRTKDTLDYYLWLAKIAERGKISAIFFADSYGGQEIYNKSKDAQYRGGSHVAKLEPTTVISAMATVTRSLGFGITGSTSYIPPYILARTWASLDHLTKGRMAWNVVTSWSQSSARALGLENLLAHDERYALAEEYMEIVYSLWEKSWAADAQVWQVEPEMAYDPSKIQKINYEGKYLKMSAVGQTHPSPQRTPIIFQAGASKAGIAFGGKHAEAIFCSQSTIAETKKYTAAVRAAAKAEGRDPQSIKFFLGTMPFIGRTVEEAQEKFERARKYCSIEGGLTRFSGFVNIDMSVFPKDQPFNFEGEMRENAIQGVISSMKSVSDVTELTPRDVGEMLALGGLGPRPIGTPEMVADELMKWVEEGDIDGFNLSPVVNPQSWEDIVDLLVPELQKRGVYWNDYPVPGGTLRENLNSMPGYPHLAPSHPGSRFKWNVLPREEVAAAPVVSEPKPMDLVKTLVQSDQVEVSA